MPTTADAQSQVADILVQILRCAPDDVVPEAELVADLGADSLLIIEIGEELGRRFDRRLPDATISALSTVQDAIDAIVRDDDALVPAPTVDENQRRTIRRGILIFAIAGLAIGGILGLGGVALLEATGLKSADLPPITAPSTAPIPTPSATSPSPTPSATSSPTVAPPSISVNNDKVSPGERFLISGKVPALGEGAELQVQVKDGDSDWDDFPITTRTRDESGTYRTELYTSRTGKRDFRLLHKESKTATPTVTVTIG